MRKIVITLIVLGNILLLGGCAGQQINTDVAGNPQAVSTPSPKAAQSPDNTGNTKVPSDTGDVQVIKKAALSGIQLGDKIDTLKEKFGNPVKEIPLDPPNYYGQNVSKFEYPNGVSLFLDKNSGIILEITVEAGDYETNLGIKLGDSAEEVFEKYNTKYKLFKGDNSVDYLKGWYIVEEGELLIFDFKEGDNTHYNEKIDSSDKVVSITLSHPKYFD